MIKDNYNEILAGNDIRANLIALKKEIKTPEGKRALAYMLGGDFQELEKLLSHEDAKVRKNAALILGQMECEEMVPALVEAYKGEQQLFVKTDYLKAIESYPYEKYLVELQERLDEIRTIPLDDSNRKHLQQESLHLENMILKYKKPRKHSFKVQDFAGDVILITNRSFRHVTREQIPEDQVKMLAGGLRVHTDRLNEILTIRTYSEILFPIPGCQRVEENPEEAANQLIKSGLHEFVKNNHNGKAPFYFRIEIRGKLNLEEKSRFAKRFAGLVEEKSQGSLRNSTSHYEVEIRLIKGKNGGFLPMVKFYTLEDNRFSYRKQSLPTSVAPWTAALMMELANPYFQEGAQVLDPFCGVGTMLIERKKKQDASPLYGIDIYGEAITKARENTESADMVINYINKDFMDFSHEYLFDEVITDLPRVTGRKDGEEIGELYCRFFQKIPKLMRDGGGLFIYTYHPELVDGYLKNSKEIKVKEKIVILDKENGVFYICMIQKVENEQM